MVYSLLILAAFLASYFILSCATVVVAVTPQRDRDAFIIIICAAAELIFTYAVSTVFFVRVIGWATVWFPITHECLWQASPGAALEATALLTLWQWATDLITAIDTILLAVTMEAAADALPSTDAGELIGFTSHIAVLFVTSVPTILYSITDKGIGDTFLFELAIALELSIRTHNRSALFALTLEISIDAYACLAVAGDNGTGLIALSIIVEAWAIVGWLALSFVIVESLWAEATFHT